MLAPRRTIASPAYLALGIGSAIVGLLPWIITGMRLPLQNLWATETRPADMPIALLPFSQYYLAFIVSLMLIGSAVAGIVGRGTAPRTPRTALPALIGGVLLVQVAAIVQSAATVAAGLGHRSAATGYLLAIVGGTVVAILLGIGILALIARAPKPGALVALSIAAVAFASWFSGLAFPIGTVVSASDYSEVMSVVIRISPAILIGAAIAWCGIGSAGRVVAAIGGLVILWIGPTLVTAVSSAAGTRVLAPYPAEMLDYGVQVFRSAIGMPDLWASNLALALGVAVVGLVGRRTMARRAVTA
ncbi:hypothetical protein BH11ACT4_BH11ACT4_24650 [soil metagenome]